MIKQNLWFTIWENIIYTVLAGIHAPLGTANVKSTNKLVPIAALIPDIKIGFGCNYSYHPWKDSITIGGEQKMKNGIIESVPKAYRPVAMIGVNIVFKVYASNWPLWNQGIDTVMQLKDQLKTKFHGP